jgi:hypothetical protein
MTNFWRAGFVDPLVHTGRTVTRRGACEDITFGFFLQCEVGDEEVNRLIFLMIRIRQKNGRKPVEGNFAIRLRIRNLRAF